MGTFRFQSQLHPGEYAFALITGSDDLFNACYPAGDSIGYKAGTYDTCGEILTQHGGLCPVLRTRAVDWMVSCAAWISAEAPAMTTKERRDILWSLEIMAGCYSTELVKFAFTVKHNSSKVQFFNPTDLRISVKAALRFDKRWYEITDRMDGSQKGALYVLQTDDGRRDMLHRLLRADAIRKNSPEGLTVVSLPELAGVVEGYANYEVAHPWNIAVNAIVTAMKYLRSRSDLEDAVETSNSLKKVEKVENDESTI